MKRKTRKNRSIILRVFILAVCGYFTLTLATLWSSLNEDKAELASLKAQLESEKNNIEELKALLNSDSNAQIIEKAARERLGYIYTDEQVFIDISGS